MRRILCTVRLSEEDKEYIRSIAVEGNVSQWIRLIVETEIKRIRDNEVQS